MTEETHEPRVIGSERNGLDVITTNSELSQVINNNAGRVKVVDYIGWCGGAGTGIIGCGYTPGWGIVVVRFSGAAAEGKLWAHEYGHNTGMGHNPNGLFIMYASYSAQNTRVSGFECGLLRFKGSVFSARRNESAGMPHRFAYRCTPA